MHSHTPTPDGHAVRPVEGAVSRAWADLPRSFGRFRLEALLGRGGMGAVYRATDPMLHRQVALKILHVLDPGSCVRFIREAQFQAQLEHPHVCAVFETDVAEGLPYISMHLVDGPTLSQAFRDLSRDELLDVVIQAALGVHAAHRQGLIHRDLKPSNILLERREAGGWHAYVADFGLARLDGGESLHLTEGLVGTPAYMAPEQLSSSKVDARADLYALGAILYHGLTGRSPFGGGTFAEVLSRRMAEPDPPPLRAFAPGLDRDLEHVVLGCLDTDPDRRYATAFALVEDLRRVREGEPVSIQAPSFLRLAGKKLQRHRVATIGVTVGAVAILLSGAFLLHNRADTQARLVWSQRLGQETREMAYLMRLEYMSPVHDLRPAKNRIRARLRAIEGELSELRGEALAAALLALGQGHLALQEPKAALPLLERAWNAGLQSPGAAQALAECNWRLILDEISTFRSKEAESLKRMKEALRRYLPKALATASGETELLRARLALSNNDPEEAQARARKALAADPWRYEALVVEATAVGLTIGSRPFAEVVQTQPERIVQARKLIDQAAGVAPSDPSLRALQVMIANGVWMQTVAHGSPRRQAIREVYQLSDLARSLDPDNPEVGGAWAGPAGQLGFDLLNHGEDPVPFLLGCLQKWQSSAEEQQNPVGYHGCFVLFNWQIAEWRLRMGGEAGPFLAEALKHSRRLREITGLSETMEVEARASEGIWLARQGKNPDPSFQGARDVLKTLMRDSANMDPYHSQLIGGVEFAQAEADLARARNPWPAIEAGLRAMRLGEAVDPGQVFLLSQRGHLEALAARTALDGGRDPAPHVREALRTARKATTARSDYTFGWWALARACDAAARAAQARGEAPARLIAEGQRAVRIGLGIHPGHPGLVALGASLRGIAADRQFKAVSTQ